MSKITEIKIMQRVNLGNYEHIEVTATTLVGENEKATDVADKTLKFVDWCANKNQRDSQATQFEKEVKSGSLSASEASKKSAWLSKYKELNEFMRESF